MIEGETVEYPASRFDRNLLLSSLHARKSGSRATLRV